MDVLGFGVTDDAEVREFGTQQIRQVPRASMAAIPHASKDGRIRQFSLFRFSRRWFLCHWFSCGRFLQLILGSNRRRKVSPFVKMFNPTAFEVIIFHHCLFVFIEAMQKKKLKVPQNFRLGTLIGFCAQHVIKVWKDLLTKSLFTKFSKNIASYMIFDKSLWQFKVLATRSEGFSPLSSQKTLFYDVGPLKGEKGVNTALLDRPENTGDALRCVTYLMFDHQHALILNHNLYFEGEE